MENDLYRILIVDDRPENLITLENILETDTRRIFKVSSGNEALKFVLIQPVELIMLDIQMPEMDGYETATLLRMNPKTKHIPIIFVSAFNKDDHRPTDRFQPGTVDFLAKPLDMNDARQKVLLYEKIHRLTCANRNFNAMQSKMSEELEQFVYSVSHDVKAPLRAITNLASWIEEEVGAGGSPSLNENITLLKNRVMRTQRMLESLTEFSRAGLIYESDQPFKADELIRGIVPTLEGAEGFRFVIGDNMPTVSTGRNKLTKIFTHLLTNAVRHNPKKKGTVEVECLELEDLLQFTVRDDGPGIGPDQRETVFELFQTLRSKDESDTVGAGLAIARKIVESMDGKIWIDDTARKGTVVHFTWKK